ncbi:SUMO deconjugating cysteine peptidase Ulp2 (predicted) [Achlya hypogyna]|uniref:SUMO deconjugating cysteine peptidase Ulp2 (Predicted) n=1 Tax=Achlya hypogyna TaxID=1202772 RepID=A0A1V9ZRY0_ACHHY|nr:SUMO deconjugating cysteine peptidase Ulp2 (predicted) [Achlya hypogyna]
MDLVEVEYSEECRSTGFGLRLVPATENGVGAVLVRCSVDAPDMRRLPPFQYQLHSLGQESLLAKPYKAIVAQLVRHTAFPVKLRYVSVPTACDLHFPKKSAKLNLKVQAHNDGRRLQISNYVKPFKTTSQIPSLLLGSHYIAAINGVPTQDQHSDQTIATMQDPQTYPMVVRLSIEQDDNSQLVQRPHLLARSTRLSMPLKRPAPPSAPRVAKRPNPAVPTKAKPPALPATSMDNPIELSDSSDDEAHVQPSPAPPPPPELSLLTRHSAVRTPFGVGAIVDIAHPPGRDCVFSVRLGEHMVGHFNRASLQYVHDVPCATYEKRRSKGQVLLTYGDIGRLDESRLFNDSILDFYFSYLLDTLPEPQPPTVVCSTFLFSRFQQARKAGLAPAHAAVKRWSKAGDLFATKYLVVPINESGHWSVAVVCNLRRFLQTDVCVCGLLQPDEPRPTAATCAACGRPRDLAQEASDGVCILVLDSLKCHRTLRTTKFLREYLQLEWDTQHRAARGPVVFSHKVLPVVVPPAIPRQTNNCDCGVFVLHYVELFLRDPPPITLEFLSAKKPKAAAKTPEATAAPDEPPHHLDASWFSAADIPAKRRLLQRLVRDPAVVRQHHGASMPAKDASPAKDQDDGLAKGQDEDAAMAHDEDAAMDEGDSPTDDEEGKLGPWPTKEHEQLDESPATDTSSVEMSVPLSSSPVPAATGPTEASV